MTRILMALLLGLTLVWFPGFAHAQNIADVGAIFEKVNPGPAYAGQIGPSARGGSARFPISFNLISW
jgi:hypothetical protein